MIPEKFRSERKNMSAYGDTREQKGLWEKGKKERDE